MLVLARRVGQTIHIGDDIVIQVISERSGMVRLGIEAPEEIKILRGEHIAQQEKHHRPERTKRLLHMVTSCPEMELGDFLTATLDEITCPWCITEYGLDPYPESTAEGL